MTALKYVPKPNTRLGKQHWDWIRLHDGGAQAMEKHCRRIILLPISIRRAVRRPQRGRMKLHMVITANCTVFQNLKNQRTPSKFSTEH